MHNIKKIDEIVINNKFSPFQTNCLQKKCIMCYIKPTLNLKLKFQSTDIYNNSFNYDKHIVKIKDKNSDWSITSKYMVDQSYINSDIIIILRDIEWNSVFYYKMNDLIKKNSLVCHFLS
tara:strand:+ start:1631 stop:1987 length:357 start_codon:yes stop_codon:yes gene_type:complete